MGRLIEANALLSEMEKYSDDTARSKNEYLFGMQQRLETCIELVEDAPTVDAVPVVHGRWKEDTGGYGFWICSHCGFVSEASGADMLYKFCPVCGAKMDGKDGSYHEG